MTARYQCCEHCLEDPSYHVDNAPDSHDTTCSTPRSGRCEAGDKRMRQRDYVLAPSPEFNALVADLENRS